MRTAIRWDRGPVLIGVIHLPPLPSSSPFKAISADKINVTKYIDDIIKFTKAEVQKLRDLGFDAAIIENFGDVPYYIKPPEAVRISLALILREVRKEFSNFPIGLSMLRNAPGSAVRTALLSGASFIRINALCTTRVSPEGTIGPGLTEALDAFSELRSDPLNLEILADINVKHSLPLSPKYSAEWEIKECASRKGPLNVVGLIVSGERTGEPPDLKEARRLKGIANALGFKLLIGSGITPDNASKFRDFDGYIIGTSLKRDHMPGSPIVPERVKILASILKD